MSSWDDVVEAAKENVRAVVALGEMIRRGCSEGESTVDFYRDDVRRFIKNLIGS